MTAGSTLLVQRKLVERGRLDRATLERLVAEVRGDPAPAGASLALAFTPLREVRCASDADHAALVAALPPGYAVALNERLCRFEAPAIARLMRALERHVIAFEPVFWLGHWDEPLQGSSRVPPIVIEELDGRRWADALASRRGFNEVLWRRRG